MFSSFWKKSGDDASSNSMTNTDSSNESFRPVNYGEGDNDSNSNIRESDFIDNTDPNTGSGDSLVTIHYGTEMPIDSLYIYITKDREEEGRQDALRNPDINCMLQKVEMLKHTLKLRFEQVRLRYEMDIRKQSAQMDNLQKLGLGGSQLQIEAFIETCREHLIKIDEMERKLDNGDISMTIMMESYKRGFNMGITESVNEMTK